MSDAALATAEPVPEVLAAPSPVPRPRRRILLTGAGGMLGSDLDTALARAGHEGFARRRAVVAGAGRAVSPRPRSDLDITREPEIARAFRELQPHVVVNCAAFTRVDDCESDPRAVDVNARGVSLLADQCLRRDAYLVQVSTDFVFDGSKRTPYTEEDPPN